MSDQTVNVQTDLNLHFEHMSEGTFTHVAYHIFTESGWLSCCGRWGEGE